MIWLRIYMYIYIYICQCHSHFPTYCNGEIRLYFSKASVMELLTDLLPCSKRLNCALAALTAPERSRENIAPGRWVLEKKMEMPWRTKCSNTFSKCNQRVGIPFNAFQQNIPKTSEDLVVENLIFEEHVTNLSWKSSVSLLHKPNLKSFGPIAKCLNLQHHSTGDVSGVSRGLSEPEMRRYSMVDCRSGQVSQMSSLKLHYQQHQCNTVVSCCFFFTGGGGTLIANVLCIRAVALPAWETREARHTLGLWFDCKFWWNIWLRFRWDTFLSTDPSFNAGSGDFSPLITLDTAKNEKKCVHTVTTKHIRQYLLLKDIQVG